MGMPKMIIIMDLEYSNSTPPSKKQYDPIHFLLSKSYCAGGKVLSLPWWTLPNLWPRLSNVRLRRFRASVSRYVPHREEEAGGGTNCTGICESCEISLCSKNPHAAHRECPGQNREKMKCFLFMFKFLFREQLKCTNLVVMLTYYSLLQAKVRFNDALLDFNPLGRISPWI